MRDRPNIVFIMADQLGAAALNCYGGGVPSTPALDRLASEGMRFDRCYATTPVCAPNRATFLTGRSPDVHGVITNNYVLRTDMPTYGHVLQRRGYRVGGFGKFHLTPMTRPLPPDFGYLGFDESVPTEDPKWGPWIDWIEREHPEFLDRALAMAWPIAHAAAYGPDRRDMLSPAMRARKELLPPRFEEGWHQLYVSPLPPELHDTTFLTDRALDFLDRHVEGHADQPFFCHVSYVDPHNPFNPPEPYASMFADADIPEPLPAAWMEKGIAAFDQMLNFVQFRKVCRNPRAIRRMRELFHGTLMLIDRQIGRIAEFLQARGLWEDTVVLFTTDHGEHLGDHGLFAKGVGHYDAGVRCPLIVAGGGVRGGPADRLTCTLDFFPTFCDLAGVDAEDRPPLEGRSFAPVCQGRPDPEPWEEVSVAFGDARSVISADGWRLTRYPREDKGQMFHLANDPGEQRDRYEDPAAADVRQRLLERLAALEARPSTIPQYRNMLALDGRMHYFGGPGGMGPNPGPPAYDLPPAPPL